MFIHFGTTSRVHVDIAYYVLLRILRISIKSLNTKCYILHVINVIVLYWAEILLTLVGSMCMSFYGCNFFIVDVLLS